MAHHNKILEHRTSCPECDYKWHSDLFQSMLFKKNQEQINWVCYCNTRLTVKENVNGFLVMRKYIKRKDKVKRIAK